MSKARKLIAAGATFSVALGIGFAMQNGDAVAARFTTTQDVPAVDIATSPVEVVMTDAPDAGPVLMQPVVPAPVLAVAMPEIQPQITIVPAPVQMASVSMDAPAEPLDMAVLLPAPQEVMPPAWPRTLTEVTPAPDVAALDCSPVMDAVTAPGAMVDLSISAPCAPAAEFVLHHQGMMVTGLTDAEGHAALRIPALSETAVFVAAFADETGAMAMISVPDVAVFDRAVLQWQGNVGVQMQVYEFGADFGSDGHVWANAPRDVAALADGKGFLVEIGATTGLAEPYRAQIYTYPAGTGSQDGSIAITVEAEITETNCGRDIAAQSIQVSPGAAVGGEDLTMTMPDCDGVGDLLMLGTMFQEFAIASN